MKILAEDLHRLCYNAIQFSSKGSSLDGVVMFSGGTHGLSVFASDDYVAMVDRADVKSDAPIAFHLGLKEVKELEKALRTIEGQVQTQFPVGENALEVMWKVENPEDVHSILLQIVSEPPDFSGVVEVVHSEPNPFTGEYSPSAEPFAIRGERFTKFRLLKTPESPSCRDGYPVDFLWDGQIIRWKCGPYLRGVVGPLARRSFVDQISGVEVTGIKDLYAQEEGVLW